MCLLKMNAQQIAKDNCILFSKVGSQLYGTNLPDSDTDYCGVFISPIEVLAGLNSFDQVDASVYDKDESGKNSSNAIDCHYHSLQKFVILAMQGNPNILERIFVNDQNIVSRKDPYCAELLKLKHEFVSKNIFARYFGYLMSQKHKMILRSDNILVLNGFLDYLTKFDSRQILIEISPDKNHELFGGFKGDIFKIGDIQIQRTRLIKDARKIIEERLSKASNRKETILKHGYDLKFSAHAVRLAVEAIELCETGELQFPLKYAEHLKDIKLGKYSLKEILTEIEHYENILREYEKNNTLRDTPNYEKLNSLVIKLTKEYNANLNN